jgi:diketogulonate reductase-like aldo/keto reductase
MIFIPTISLLVQWSKDNGLLLEAYSPLGGAKQVKESLQVPEVRCRASRFVVSTSVRPNQYDVYYVTGQGNRVYTEHHPCTSPHILGNSTWNNRFAEECHAK